MDEPRIDAPEDLSKTEILYAALCASTRSDRLMIEAQQWREISHDLFERVDDITEKAKVMHRYER